MAAMFRGVVPPIVTPVDDHENVDPAALKRVVDYVLAGGVHGVFVNGSNGEFYGLSFENQMRAAQVVVEQVGGRVPVFVGASAVTTKDAVRLAVMAEAVGAQAVTALTPMFIQPSDDELFEHFRSIAAATKLPVLLYNNPGKTTNNISPALLGRLLSIDRIVGIKNTAIDFSLTMKYIAAGQGKEGFGVFGGLDYYIYATLSHGGVGCVAGTANVAPRLVVDIYEKYLAGDHTGALAAQTALIPLRDVYGLGSFPVMMKVCLNLLGVDVGRPIRPISYVDAATEEAARKVLRSIGLL